MPIQVATTDGNKVRQAQTDQGTNPLAGMTVAQADAWVTTNVTDLASAKVALKYAVKIMFWLAFRLTAVENRLKNN